MGGRAAQHVEADPSGRPLVPWRQPAAGALLLAAAGTSDQGSGGRHQHTGIRLTGGPSSSLMRVAPTSMTRVSVWLFPSFGAGGRMALKYLWSLGPFSQKHQRTPRRWPSAEGKECRSASMPAMPWSANGHAENLRRCICYLGSPCLVSGPRVSRKVLRRWCRHRTFGILTSGGFLC